MPRQETRWPEIVFAGDVTRAGLAKAAAEGRLVRLVPGLYSGRPRSNQAEVVGRNWHQILGHELPGAVISDRSARRSGPDGDLLTVVHPRRRPLELPGLTILPRAGEGPLPGDSPGDGVWLASQARGLLENLRGRALRRYLSPREIESWLTDIIGGPNGADQLNFIRDRARDLAEGVGWQPAFRRLDALIGAILSTRPSEMLESEALRARATGAPYDHRRIELFEAFVSTLRERAPEPLPLLAGDAERRRLLPFYEAYFSNYIEGTEFTLDEAAAIVYAADVPAGRPEDAHDILGTYQIVADPTERSRIPADSDGLLELLLERHARLIGARPDKRPGRFKERANRAGATVFVAPELVQATLQHGFDIARPLLDPFARAVYMGFLVAEVHPFDDGNGRISRIVMNAELSAHDEGRIIIPTVYRNDYLAGLRGASHNANFASLPAILRFAQRYTARLDFSTRQTAEAALVQTNALRDPTEADEVGVRLQMP